MRKAPSLWLTLLISVIVCLAAGFLSGIATMNSIHGWYTTINKPSFNPPDAVFGPVWTVLYILMGVSFGLLLNKGWFHPKRTQAVILFVLQLLLNIAWSFIFFTFHSLLGALIEIAVLWIAIIVCIVQFYKIYRPSAYLLIPYLLWVSFAKILTFAIWQMN